MASETEHRWLEVAAGLVIDADGRLLLGQRPEGKSYAGWWELPGGKLEPGETAMQALKRELHEELGIEVTEATPWVTYVHEYPHATVRLAFCRVTGWRGEPQGLENQALRWVDPRQPLEVLEAGLGGGHLLPATLPPVRWLSLPDRYLVLGLKSPADVPGHLARVEQALAAGIHLLQFRAPEWQGGTDDDALFEVVRRTLAPARSAGARLLVNSVHPESWWREADGVQLRAADLGRFDSRPQVGLLGASCHSADDLARARQLEADFALLGPVLPTATHPDHPGLGWEAFAELNAKAGMPVLAIGGQSSATLATARQHGAHGIAGIRHLLD
ncbi:MAG: Nudix family hydrolase [Pigmentiphaga sp.]